MSRRNYSRKRSKVSAPAPRQNRKRSIVLKRTNADEIQNVAKNMFGSGYYHHGSRSNHNTV